MNSTTIIIVGLLLLSIVSGMLGLGVALRPCLSYRFFCPTWFIRCSR